MHTSETQKDAGYRTTKRPKENCSYQVYHKDGETAMADVKQRLALKHWSGRYLSWSIDNFPLTPKLSQARRFFNMDELKIFLETSPYAPDNPEEYEIITIKITYEEVEERAEHGDLRESQIGS